MTSGGPKSWQALLGRGSSPFPSDILRQTQLDNSRYHNKQNGAQLDLVRFFVAAVPFWRNIQSCRYKPKTGKMMRCFAPQEPMRKQDD